MTNETIIYDQPLNEIIRFCLRLEQLFQQIDHQLADETILGCKNVLILIINILQTLDRPDLKAKLAKELSTLLTHLQKYCDKPGVDSDKYKHLTHHLGELSRRLIDSSGKIGHRLRDIELLNTLRLHLANPGGGASFDMPLLHYWLQQPPEVRKNIIKDWLQDFIQIREASTVLLDLLRKNGKVESKTAVRGFHQELLDPNANLRMIRIIVDSHIPAYPELSIGRHFLSIRFFVPDILKRPEQYTGDLPFLIVYCSV